MLEATTGIEPVCRHVAPQVADLAIPAVGRKARTRPVSAAGPRPERAPAG